MEKDLQRSKLIPSLFSCYSQFQFSCTKYLSIIYHLSNNITYLVILNVLSIYTGLMSCRNTELYSKNNEMHLIS